jgi:energy-coupling factor transporter ATP-binding protein EcfA2
VSLNLTVTQLTFSDGTSVSIPPRGVIALVGPNNVGKTATLREILGSLEANTQGQTVRDVKFTMSGTKDDAREWLDKNSMRTERHGTVFYTRTRGDELLALAEVDKILLEPSKGLGTLASLVGIMLNAEQRLGAAQSAEALDSEEHPTLPIQKLLENEILESWLRKEAIRTFGAEFIIQRSPGKKIIVHWGKEPLRGTDGDRVSPAYLKELQDLPLLGNQGDGLRSFLGTLFYLKLASEFVVMIDEPEAFLHPPQERRLGTLVGQLAGDRQVFVATHSSDFLRGLMDGRPDELVIIHLRRDGFVNKPKILQSAGLAKIWADPMLRYSNILDGLFHDLVILCEGETDCRFYHAVFDFLWMTRGPKDAPQPSMLFADVGGKDAFPRATAALTAFGVPLRIIGDFDILNREELLSRLCSLLGAEWDEFAQDWKLVSNAVQKKGAAPPLIEELLRALKEKCGTDAKQRLDQELSKQLSDIVQYPKPWADAKRSGKAVIPSGQESIALEKLLERFKSIGIHVVPLGEVECWIRTVGGKGMAWLTQVFAEMKAESIQFPKELLEFFAGVIAFPLGESTSLPTVIDTNADRKAASSVMVDDTRDIRPAGGLAPKWKISLDREHVLHGLIALAVILALVALLRTL